MAISHGYDAKPNGDHFISIAKEATAIASEVLLPGAHLAADFPLCTFLSTSQPVLLLMMHQCCASLHGSLVWVLRKRHEMDNN